jgi:hypothetical protein
MALQNRTKLLHALAKISTDQGIVLFLNQLAAELQALLSAIPTSALVCETGGAEAAAGELGEYKSATRAATNDIALTSGDVTNVTSLLVPAGDWDLVGRAGVLGVPGTTITYFAGGLNTVNNLIGADEQFEFRSGSFTLGSARMQFVTPGRRVNISADQIFYLNATATFAGATLGAYGFMAARRRT